MKMLKLNRGRLNINMFVIMLIFILIIFVSVFALSHFFVENVLSNIYIKNYVDDVHKNFEQNINSFISQININMLNFTTNDEICTILIDEKSTQPEKYDRLNSIVSPILDLLDYVDEIAILTFDGEEYYFSKNKTQFSGISSNFINTSSALSVAIDDKCYFNGDTPYILLGKRFWNVNRGINLGHLLIFVKEETIQELYCTDENKDEISYLSINNRIISHSDKSLLNAYSYVPSGLQYGNAKKSREYIINYQFSHKNIENISMINIISNRIFLETIQLFDQRMFLIGFIVVVAVLIISFFFSHKLSKSLIVLSNKMQQYPNIKIIDAPMSKNTEIIQLERHFHEMIAKIELLMQKISESEKQQRITELKALQAQINPHFIYNALDVICSISKIERQPLIEHACVALSSYFKMSLHRGDTHITLEDEIKQVQSYIHIEKLRFPNKFDVKFEIDEILYKEKLLKILIQPLVENSIKHGFDNIKYTGIITISGTIDNDYIILKVIDNGIGLNGVNPLTRTDTNVETESGYGVYNVNERIILEYGDDCGISYCDTDGGGTTAILKLKRKL